MSSAEEILDSLMGAVSRCSMHTTYEAAERLRTEMARSLATHLPRAITAAVAAEREACWRKADEIAADFASSMAPYCAHGATTISDAIRARDTP